MTSETKQDVFDEAVAALEYARQQKDGEGSGNYRARYAAASDGDPACPYCHDEEGQPCGPDGYYANNLSIGSDGYIEDSDKIKYCQYCGRSLRASHD